MLPYYSTASIISKNFHILSSMVPYYFTILFHCFNHKKNFRILSAFNMNEMGSHWVLFLMYLNIVLSGPEVGRLRSKHVAKYNLIIIIASCLDVCCVLTVQNILYKFDMHNGIASLKKKTIRCVAKIVNRFIYRKVWRFISSRQYPDPDSVNSTTRVKSIITSR